MSSRHHIAEVTLGTFDIITGFVSINLKLPRITEEVHGHVTFANALYIRDTTLTNLHVSLLSQRDPSGIVSRVPKIAY